MSTVLRLILLLSILLALEVNGTEEFWPPDRQLKEFTSAENFFRQGKLDQACRILKELSSPKGGSAIGRYEALCYWAMAASTAGNDMQDRTAALVQITEALGAIATAQKAELEEVRAAKPGPYDLRHLHCRRACVALALSCGDLESAKLHTATATQIASGSDLVLPANREDACALSKQLIEWLIDWNLALGETEAAERVARKHLKLGAHGANKRFREVRVLLRLGERSQIQVEDHLACYFYRKASGILASIRPSKEEEAQYAELVGRSSSFFQGRAFWSSVGPEPSGKADELDAVAAQKLMTRWADALVAGDSVKASGCVLAGNEGIKEETRYWLDIRPKELTFSSPIPAAGATANLGPGKVAFDFTIVYVTRQGKREKGEEAFVFVRDGDAWRIAK